MKNLRLMLKNKYKLAVGEFSLEELRNKVVKASKVKMKVSGRDYLTGKRKTINVPLYEFLG